MSIINVATNAFTCHQEDDLAIITILDGAGKMSTTVSGKVELLETLNMLKANPQVKGVAILYSDKYQGDAEYKKFMKETLKSKDFSTQSRFAVTYKSAIIQFLEEVITFPKPIVGGMKGDIDPATFAVNLAFDLRVATEDTSFVHPNLKLGLPPSPPLAYYLVQSLGSYRATELIFKKSELTAKDALELGLITKVVSSEDLKKSCFDQLRKLTYLSENCLVETRRMLQPEIAKMHEYFDAGFASAVRCINQM
jgi:enoyl-CoA hydratase/carnithine racemase